MNSHKAGRRGDPDDLRGRRKMDVKGKLSDATSEQGTLGSRLIRTKIVTCLKVSCR